MAHTATVVPVKKVQLPAEKVPAAGTFHPFESLRREVDRLFDDFGANWHLPFRRSWFDLEPAWRRASSWGIAPAIDIAEKEKAFEITAELPGMQEKDIEVTLANNRLCIKGEKKEETEEKKKDYYLSERRYGSFERSFEVPETVDTDRIAATFSSGVLKLVMPKTAGAQKEEKKIEVKAA
ncbi:MAG: Hsp20/alpha crystallin family protein [Gammaproteobacteria bacterium]|nr:Hsp20/alpha crystallin family protein [Gammaproteobacteria bacterium]